MKNLYLVLLSLLALSCNKPNKEITDDYRVTAEYSIAFRKFSSGNVANLELPDSIGTVDTLHVNEIRTRKKSIWIYKTKYTADADTLISYKDSVITLKGKKLEELKTRQFEFNNSKVLVSKHVFTLPNTMVLNIFVADGLGIVLTQSQEEPNTIVAYNTDYKALHKSIMSDADFFTFESVPKKTK